MRGKPFLIVFAAFAIVLIGGAAMAGIGTYWNVESSPAVSAESDEVQVTPTRSVPKATTTTFAAKDPEPQQVTSDKPVQQESDAVEEAEPVDATNTDTDDQEPAPAFALTHPQDGARFKSKVVAFGGAAGEDITVHRGKYKAIPEEGEWVMELVLSPGKNYVSFEGIDANGNATVASVTVYYDAPAKDKKDEKKDDQIAFIAHQKYGSCSEVPPYDVFYGTAKPGAKITASSPYGSASTVANEKGKWEMKVMFPDAPPGKTFNVTIKASTGQIKTFAFTNTGGGKDG